MTLRFIYLLAGFIFFSLHTSAQYKLEWAISSGSTGFDEGFSVVTDGSGNVYTTGSYQGTVDFDPGASTFNLSAVGSTDIFIQKLDANGNFVWAKSIGGTVLDQGKSITVDKNGDVYVTGTFSGNNVDFDPGPGTFNLSAGNTNNEIFVLKLNAAGNFQWAFSAGSTGVDNGESIVTDTAGNVYVTGFFSGTVDFDPGVPVVNLTSNGSNDVFIQKLSPTGNLIWVKSIGASGTERAFAIAADNADQIYVAGYFENTVDFDPNGGTLNLTASGRDAFVVKLNTAGNLTWARSFGGSGGESGEGIAVDALGNVYTVGYFFGTTDLDPGAGTQNHTANGAYDAYVQKLDGSGNFVWGAAYGGTGFDYANDITVDTMGTGAAYIIGRFEGTVDFDPGAGTSNFTSQGSSDIYIEKLDGQSGNFAWAFTAGNTSTDIGDGITADQSGNLHAVGAFAGTVDFDPTSGITNLTANTSYDVFVQKLGPCVPNTGIDVRAACDSLKWINGITYYSSNNTAKDTLINISGCDSVVTLNLTINYTATGIDVITACDSLLWIDGNKYYASNNTATHRIVAGAASGCDSVVTLNLTLNNSSTGVDVVTACDSLLWIDGNTYFNNNNSATHNIIGGAANGCDSMVTLNLTIIPSSTGTDFVTACDSVTWIDGNTYYTSASTATHNIVGGAANGCDSLVTLNLTILTHATGTDVVTVCDSFLWIDGNTYYASNNTATHNIVGGAANGCDSLVTLNLTVNTVDVSVVTVDPIITAIMTGASYQWLDCNNNFAVIPGATAQNYIATANGDYAVEITSNGCVDTSSCETIVTIGVEEGNLFGGVSVYPNPVDGPVQIELGGLHDVSIRVYDVSGKLYYAADQVNTFVHQFQLQSPSGVYILELVCRGEFWHQKLVKE